MVQTMSKLSSTTFAVHNIMKVGQARLCNAELLLNMKELRPIIQNETQWSGEYYTFERFSEIRNELIQACNEAYITFQHKIPQHFQKK